MSTWAVHVHGPDDVIHAVDEQNAKELAAEVNGLELEHVSAHVIRDNVFDCVEAEK